MKNLIVNLLWSKASFSFQLMTSNRWYSMENLAVDILWSKPSFSFQRMTSNRWYSMENLAVDILWSKPSFSFHLMSGHRENSIENLVADIPSQCPSIPPTPPPLFWIVNGPLVCEPIVMVAASALFLFVCLFVFAVHKGRSISFLHLTMLSWWTGWLSYRSVLEKKFFNNNKTAVISVIQFIQLMESCILLLNFLS